MIGLQLFTVRDELKKDLKGTLEKIAKTGYTLIEAAGYEAGKLYGMPPADFASLAADCGLKLYSCHAMIDSRTIGSFVENLAAAGVSYLVYPWIPDHERRTIDDWRYIISMLNEIGYVCHQNGIKFCYHNHDFEFEPLFGILPYNLLLGETDPEHVNLELDFYWVIKAGHDPLDFFKRFPGRFPLWHIKDMKNNSLKSMTEAGQGVIDFPAYFKQAKLAGLVQSFVEQDECVIPPMDSIKIGFEYMKQLEKSE